MKISDLLALIHAAVGQVHYPDQEGCYAGLGAKVMELVVILRNSAPAELFEL